MGLYSGDWEIGRLPITHLLSHGSVGVGHLSHLDAPPSRREEPKRIRVWVVRRRALVVKRPHQTLVAGHVRHHPELQLAVIRGEEDGAGGRDERVSNGERLLGSNLGAGARLARFVRFSSGALRCNYPRSSVVRVSHAKRPRLGHRLQVGFLHGEPTGFRVCLVDGAAKSRDFPSRRVSFVAPRAPQRELHHLVSHRHAPRQRPVLQHQRRQVALVLERRENLRVGAKTSTTVPALHHGARRRR